MANSKKNLIIINTEDNRETSMPKEGFLNMKRNPMYHLWTQNGYDNPNDVIPCWYVTEEERLSAIKNQRGFCEPFETYEYFKIKGRIDSIHIEGYLGRKDHEMTYHEGFISSLDYFVDYKKRKKLYFTFDKVSLYQVMEIMPENPLRFILKRVDNQKAFKKNTVFMIMPFHNKELDKFYFNSIKSFLKEKLDIGIYRADDFRDNDIIIQTIYNLIEESEFIIADTTVDNKNAFYELGYASAIGKEIITIQNKKVEQKLFFDRSHIRTIMYNPLDIPTFQFDLDSTIKSIRDRQ